MRGSVKLWSLSHALAVSYKLVQLVGSGTNGFRKVLGMDTCSCNLALFGMHLPHA